MKVWYDLLRLLQLYNIEKSWLILLIILSSYPESTFWHKISSYGRFCFGSFDPKYIEPSIQLRVEPYNDRLGSAKQFDCSRVGGIALLHMYYLR